MSYKQGDIVIVKFPFTDLSDSKNRPALIVSNEKVNKAGDYLIVMITTQKYKGDDLRVKITNRNISIPFKPPHKEMYVYYKKIATLNDSIIKKKITKLKPDTLELIISEIENIIST